MALIDRIVRGASYLRASSGSSGTPDYSAFDRNQDGWMSTAYSSGMRITPETVKRIGAAQACTSIISRNIAMMPLKVFTDTERGKKLATECPEYKLLYSRPNDRQTAFEFRQMQQGHFELSGNAYAEKVMDRRGTTLQLLPMHPARVIPQVLANGRMTYRYNDPLTNQTRVLVQEEVFHLRNWSDDGYVGQSTVSLGKDVFGVAMAAQDYSARFFQNDGKPGLYFEKTTPGKSFRTEADKEEFRENWQKAQTGANRHKVAIIPTGFVLKEFGMKPSDAQLLDARKFSRIEICSLFGVPPHLIGETEKAATYASVEQFNIMFATQCLLPRVVAWEQALQRDILQDDRFSAKFSMSALLRGDNASRTAAYAVGIQNGWLSQNDVRLLDDLNPIEGGDTYWRPLAWTPLDNLATAIVTGNAGKSEGASTGDPEETAAMEHAANIAHNVQVLGAMAGKSTAQCTALLAQMKEIR